MYYVHIFWALRCFYEKLLLLTPLLCSLNTPKHGVGGGFGQEISPVFHLLRSRPHSSMPVQHRVWPQLVP
jgi:hypothetical protein